MARSHTYKKKDRLNKLFAIGLIMILGGYMQVKWVMKTQTLSSPFKIDHLEKARCSHCKGRGKIPFFLDPSEMRECPICYGAGSRLVKINPEFQQPCPSCFGLGRLYNKDTHHGVNCITCMGRGAILRGHLQPNLPEPPKTPATTNSVPKETGETNNV